MEIPPVIPVHTNTANQGISKGKTISSIMNTQKVRSTRSSRLREEQHKAAVLAASASQRTLPAKLPSSSSSASSGTSTPSVAAATSTQGAVPPLSLAATKSKLHGAAYQTLRNPIPAVPVTPGSNNVSSSNHVTPTKPTRSAAGTVTPSSTVVFSDSDPSPASSINSRPSQSQSSSTSYLATPSTSSVTSIMSSTPSTNSGAGGLSLFSMPPQSTASPRLTSQSMSILHLTNHRSTPSPSVSTTSTNSSAPTHHHGARTAHIHPSSSSSAGASRHTSAARSRAPAREPSREVRSQLSTAQRAVLEDIHIISDWLGTVQQSEPQHLLQFRSVIARMKKTIFMPAQVKRARAQQKNSTGSEGKSGVTPTRPTTATHQLSNLTPLERKLARHVLTGLNVHFDLTSSFDTTFATQLGYSKEDMEDLNVVPLSENQSNVSASGGGGDDDSDYEDLDGGSNEEDFDSKLSSYIKRTTKRDDEVYGHHVHHHKGPIIPGSGVVTYHHAPGVAFENGRWVPKDLPAETNAVQAKHLSSHRSYSSDAPSHGGATGGGGGGDFSDADLDDIPDFSQVGSSSNMGGDDPSSSSPSSMSQRPPTGQHVRRGSGGGSVNSMSFVGSSTGTQGGMISSAGGRMRSSSNSQSLSTASYGQRHRGALGGGASSRAGASSVSVAGAVSPGSFFQDDSEEPSMSMRSNSPSHAISMSQSQSVFSREDREMMLFRGAGEGEGGEDDLEDAFGDLGDTEDQMQTMTLLPQHHTRATPTSTRSAPGGISTAGKKGSISALSPAASRKTPHSQTGEAGGDEFDVLDAIPDFGDEPPQSVVPVAVVRPTGGATAVTTAAPGTQKLAPFPFAQPGGGAPAQASPSHTKPASGGFTAPSGNTSSGGPTLITMQSWTALGRPGSLDAGSLSAAGGLSPSALAALQASIPNLPSAPTKPESDVTLFSKAKKEDFPDELDLGDDQEDEEEETTVFVKPSTKETFPDELDFGSDEEDEEQLPLSQPAKSTIGAATGPSKMQTITALPPTSTSQAMPQATNARPPSNMQTFTTLPAGFKLPSSSSTGGASTPSLSSKSNSLFPGDADDLDDLGFDDDDPISTNNAPSSSVGASGGLKSPSSTNSQPSATTPTSTSGSGFFPSSTGTAAPTQRKSFATKFTQFKKKKVADDDIPMDLDDLSDADFSDEDRGGPDAAAALLGPAARQLNEFDVTPELTAVLKASELAHTKVFDGGLAKVGSSAGANQRMQTLLQTDGMTPSLRAEFVSQKFTIDFILRLTQDAAPVPVPTTSVPPGAKHKVKSASAAASLVSPSTSHSHSTSISSSSTAAALPPRPPSTSGTNSATSASTSTSKIPVATSSSLLTSPTHQRGKSSPHAGSGKK